MLNFSPSRIGLDSSLSITESAPAFLFFQESPLETLPDLCSRHKPHQVLWSLPILLHVAFNDKSEFHLICQEQVVQQASISKASTLFSNFSHKVFVHAAIKASWVEKQGIILVPHQKIINISKVMSHRMVFGYHPKK